MAYDASKITTLGHLKTGLSAAKTDYEAKIAAAGGHEVATDEEVQEVLDEVFGTTAEDN